MDTNAKRPRWRTNLAYAATPRLLLGVEYNAAAGEWTPTANWVALLETKSQPQVTFGTSSDRIFSPPHKQAYFVTAAKTVTPKVAPYMSLSYSEWEDTLLVPFGCSFALDDTWSLLPMSDGRNSHLMLTYSKPGISVSALWVRLRHPGISVGVSF